MWAQGHSSPLPWDLHLLLWWVGLLYLSRTCALPRTSEYGFILKMDHRSCNSLRCGDRIVEWVLAPKWRESLSGERDIQVDIHRRKTIWRHRQRWPCGGGGRDWGSATTNPDQEKLKKKKKKKVPALDLRGRMLHYNHGFQFLTSMITWRNKFLSLWGTVAHPQAPQYHFNFGYLLSTTVCKYQKYFKFILRIV